MIPKECKRLAEVDFPIGKVSNAASAEKEGRIAHVPKLHVWPAARPTGACRGILLALLLPDPCDPSCPTDFVHRARNILPRVQGKPGSSNEALREELMRFIGTFSVWDNAAKDSYIEAARALVKAAHGDDSPLVVDPFSGG